MEKAPRQVERMRDGEISKPSKGHFKESRVCISLSSLNSSLISLEKEICQKTEMVENRSEEEVGSCELSMQSESDEVEDAYRMPAMKSSERFSTIKHQRGKCNSTDRLRRSLYGKANNYNMLYTVGLGLRHTLPPKSIISNAVHANGMTLMPLKNQRQ